MKFKDLCFGRNVSPISDEVFDVNSISSIAPIRKRVRCYKCDDYYKIEYPSDRSLRVVVYYVPNPSAD